jgi:tetratricopeptide (TPR) repeat protein
LFSSFERHLPLERLLDKIGEAFPGLRSREGKEWDAVTDPVVRRNIALQALAKIPVLWVWDNVELVAGFPVGATSEWSETEQQELVDFLRDATAPHMQAKFLLTSRREEREWLGDLPTRIEVPPMPMRERLQLAHAPAGRRGVRAAALPDLRPLLRFTGGNPLTILVTVGQALRESIDTRERLEAYVAKLRTGAQEFTDEAEGRDKNLAASLSYGFRGAVSEDEQRGLSLLHLFQGSVDADALRVMGVSRVGWCIEAVRGWTREQWMELLDRAAEIGQLTALGDGAYEIHPALPWFFRGLFARFHPGAAGERARKAFAAAMAVAGVYWSDRYIGGDQSAFSALAKEEDNLHAGWALARERGMLPEVINTMQGLRVVYGATGRRGPWRRLVETVVPDFFDPATDGPLPGREMEWGLVNEYRVQLAQEDRDWSAAERMQRLRVDYSRRIAEPALSAAPETWSDEQRGQVRWLSVAVSGLGEILMQQYDKRCIANFEEALRLAQQLCARHDEGVCAFRLGSAHLQVAQDLDAAERCYLRSLELLSPDDNLVRACSLGQLGRVALLRYLGADANRPDAELLAHLNTAAAYSFQTLHLLPDTAATNLGATHSQLGEIYDHAGETDRALHHYRQSIRYSETSTDFYGAGRVRQNVAMLLWSVGRLIDARIYFEAALANFREFGDRAARRR